MTPKIFMPRKVYMNRQKFSRKFVAEDIVSHKYKSNFKKRDRLEAQCSILAKKLKVTCKKLAEMDIQETELHSKEIELANNTTSAPISDSEPIIKIKHSKNLSDIYSGIEAYAKETNQNLHSQANYGEMDKLKKPRRKRNYFTEDLNGVMKKEKPSTEEDQIYSPKIDKFKEIFENLDHLEYGDITKLENPRKHGKRFYAELNNFTKVDELTMKEKDEEAEEQNLQELNETVFGTELENQNIKRHRLTSTENNEDTFEKQKLSGQNMSQSQDNNENLEKMGKQSNEFEENHKIDMKEDIFQKNEYAIEEEKQDIDIVGEYDKVKLDKLESLYQILTKSNVDLEEDESTSNENIKDNFDESKHQEHLGKCNLIEESDKMDQVEKLETKLKNVAKESKRVFRKHRHLPEMKSEPLEETNMLVDIRDEPSEADKIQLQVQELSQRMAYNKLIELEKIRMQKDNIPNILVVNLMDDDEDFKTQFKNEKCDKLSDNPKLETRFSNRPHETETDFHIMDKQLKRAKQFKDIKYKSDLSNFVKLKHQSQELGLKKLQAEGKLKHALSKVESTLPDNKPKVRKCWIAKSEYESDYHKRCAQQQVGKSLREECKNLVNLDTFPK